MYCTGVQTTHKGVIRIKRKRLTTEERQQQIIHKSLEIIHEEGFSILTIQNIANRIGISQAAIYRHFEDKHQIVDHLSDLAFHLPLTAVQSPDTCNPAQRLHLIISGQIQELEKNPYLTAIVF